MIEYNDSPFIKYCRRRPSNPGGEKWGEWMRWRGCWEGRFGWRGNTNPRNHRSRTSHWKLRGAGREGFGKCVHFVPCTMLYHTLCTMTARPQNLDIKEWMSRQNSIWSSLHGEEQIINIHLVRLDKREISSDLQNHNFFPFMLFLWKWKCWLYYLELCTIT